MEFTFKNENKLIDIFITYINDHNKLPMLNYKLDKKQIICNVKKLLESRQFKEKEIQNIKIIDAKNSIDKKDVILPIKILKINKNKIFIEI